MAGFDCGVDSLWFCGVLTLCWVSLPADAECLSLVPDEPDCGDPDESLLSETILTAELVED